MSETPDAPVAPKLTPEQQEELDCKLIAEAVGPINVPWKKHCTSNRDQLFHEPTVAALVRRYKKLVPLGADGKSDKEAAAQPEAIRIMQMIVVESLPLIDTTILKHKFIKLDDLEALRAECVMKILRIASKQDTERGTCFSYFSFALKRFLISHAKKVTSKSSAVSFIDEESLENMEGIVYINPDISEEFLETLDALEVRNLGELNNEVLRYYLEFLVTDGLKTPKNKLTAAAVQIHGITPDNAAFLYDFLMVRLRTHLLDRPPAPFKDLDVLKLTKRFSTLPELAQLIGPQTFAKTATIFGGQTFTIPTAKDWAKMMNHKAWLNDDNNDEVISNYKDLQDNFLDDACEDVKLNPKGFTLSGNRHRPRVCSDDLAEGDIRGAGDDDEVDHIELAMKK